MSDSTPKELNLIMLNHRPHWQVSTQGHADVRFTKPFGNDTALSIDTYEMSKETNATKRTMITLSEFQVNQLKEFLNE